VKIINDDFGGSEMGGEKLTALEPLTAMLSTEAKPRHELLDDVLLWFGW
jgi:hypothetical protein